MSIIYRWGNWEYELNGKYAAIVKCCIPSAHLEIPDEVDGHVVTAIKGKITVCSGVIKDIIFSPSSKVTVIPDKFCWDEYALERVVLPDGIETIGRDAFANCRNLSINTPKNLKNIGHRAFILSGISAAVITDKTISIGTGAFSGCTEMKGDVKLPSSVLYISSEAFRNSSITSLDMSDCNNLDHIPERMCVNCRSLETIVLPNNPINPLMIFSKAFAYCPNLRTVKNSQNIEKIYGMGFAGCDKLRVMRLDKIEAVGYDCFALGNPKLAVYIPPKTPNTSDIWDRLQNEGINVRSVCSPLKQALYIKNVSKDWNDCDER